MDPATGYDGMRKNRKQGGRFGLAGACCVVLAAGCVIFAGYQIFRHYGSSYRAEAQLEELRELREQSETETASEKAGAASEKAEATSEKAEAAPEKAEAALEKAAGSKRPAVSEKRVKKQNPYKEVFVQNEDMIAWLQIQDTQIDYPVMYTPEDEDYYLNRDFYGREDTAGSLLLDSDSSLYRDETTNLIIHGHHMKSGAMFGDLDLYADETYGKAHKDITLYTRKEQKNYEVIAAFYSQVYLTTDTVFKYYNFFQADTEEEFHYFYDNIKELSLYDTGVTAQFGDHFLTLSTCAYHVEDGRFVVVAKEVEPGPEYELIVYPVE